MNFELELKSIKNYFDLAKEDIFNNSIGFEKKIKVQDKIDGYSKIYEICTFSNFDDADQGALYCYQFYQKNMEEYCLEIKNKLINDNFKNINEYYKKFNYFIKWLKPIFNYLDRHYVINNNLPNLERDLPKQLFMKIIFKDNYKKINKIIDLEIEDFRKNNIEEIYKTKNFFLISKDLDNNFYQELLDNLLENLKLNYNSNQKEIYVKTSNAIEYFNQIKNKFNIELKIASYLFDINFNEEQYLLFVSSTNNFINLIVTEFVDNYIRLPIDEIFLNKEKGIIKYIHNKNFIELKQIYKFINFDDSFLNYLAIHLSEFLIKDIENCFPINLINFNKFVNLLVDIHNIYHKYFDDNHLLINSIKNKIINLIEKDKDELKKFIDILILNFRNNIDISITIVTLISEKDYFFKSFLLHFENTIFNKKDFSLDQERLILDEFKLNFKDYNINKYNTMLSDIVYNSEFNQELNKVIDKKDINYQVQILTTGIWRNPTISHPNINIPESFKEYQVLTQELYHFKNSTGRKLDYCHEMGEIELNLNQVTIKTVPIIGMILLLFNDYQELTISEISEKLNIKESQTENYISCILNASIYVLIKINHKFLINYKILESQNKQEIEIKLIHENAIKSIKNKISQETIADKKLRCDAIIINYMKKELTINKDNLVKYSIDKLKNWGVDKDLIDKSIGSLIERDYLEEKDNNIDYVP